MHFNRFLYACLLALAIPFTSGCGGVDRTNAAPPAATHAIMYPKGFPDVRYFGDDAPLSVEKEVAAFSKQAKAAHKDGGGLHILAISGGGSNGAFGAGVLNGWTKSGTRPEFDVVTGISTGSLIAPFAFLGPDYDAAVKRVYTTTSTRQLVTKRYLSGIFSGGSLYSTKPLRRVIEREFTDAMIDAIADEYPKGRRLLLGTTNMDAERPVIWNITEIAAYRTPEARKLVRDIVWASAAIPILFTPVQFIVTDGTTDFVELHSDGGVTQEIFTYSPQLPVRRYLQRAGLAHANNRVWIIHNNHINPIYKPQSTKLAELGQRTVQSLIKSQSIGDLQRIAALAERDGFSLRAMILPARFTEQSKELFDPGYMTRLFSIGEQLGIQPNAWGRRLEKLFEQDKIDAILAAQDPA